MKKILIVLTLFLALSLLISCDRTQTTTITTPSITETEKSAYRLLIEAEELSGMSRWNNQIIDSDGSLGLPTEYQGVTITYSSRQPDIISDGGIVTLPDTCWIESRDQQGTDDDRFEGLNDNWPVVVDVTLSFQGETRTAKLLFIVAPAEGFTCDKYLG